MVNKQLVTYVARNGLMLRHLLVTQNGIMLRHQSAYWEGHSSETALLRIFNDIIDAIAPAGKWPFFAFLTSPLHLTWSTTIFSHDASSFLWDQRSSPILASRLPYGEVTVSQLGGFYVCLVPRPLRSAPRGGLALPLIHMWTMAGLLLLSTPGDRVTADLPLGLYSRDHAVDGSRPSHALSQQDRASVDHQPQEEPSD